MIERGESLGLNAVRAEWMDGGCEKRIQSHFAEPIQGRVSKGSVYKSMLEPGSLASRRVFIPVASIEILLMGK